MVESDYRYEDFPNKICPTTCQPYQNPHQPVTGCFVTLTFQGHWWPLKGQILAIFSHFDPVLIHRKLHIFGLILKNKMAARDVYLTYSKDFCWHSRAKRIIDRDHNFAEYVPHYKVLIFSAFFEKQDGRHGRFFVNHEKCLYLPY